MGIENTKKVVHLGLKSGELVAGLIEGIGLEDGLKAISVIKSLVDALHSFDEVIPELADLTEAEKSELKAYVVSDFDIENDKVEAAIEGALSLAVELSELAKLFISKPVPVPGN